MRKPARVAALAVMMLALAANAVVLSANAAFATGGAITAPSGNPFKVPGTQPGAPKSFTISANGFATGAVVKVEICDGLNPASTAPAWDLSTDCDLGSQTAGQSSPGTSSTITFPAGDANFGIVPFNGASPQDLFTCYRPTQWATANNGTVDPTTDLPAWNNCQIRVASTTSDQVFSTMILPSPWTAPGVPTAVKAVSGSTTTGTGSMKVTFTPGAISPGSAIAHSTATCTSTNGGGTHTGSSASGAITVAGTVTGKTYTCKVTSTNNAVPAQTSGPSAASPAVIEGTPAAPTAVKAHSGTTSTSTGPLTVTFTAGVTNGSALTTPKYTATCTSSNGGAAKSAVGTTTTITVASATTGKTYTCTVKEHNVRGTGLSSAASLPVIVGSPAPVATPTVAKTANGVLKATFTLLTAAQANGSALTTPKYTATCTSSNGGVTKSVAGTGSPISVTGLTTGKTYTCTVKAHNARGYGLSSAPSAAHAA